MKRIPYLAAFVFVIPSQACGRNPMERFLPKGEMATGGSGGTIGSQGTGGSADCPPCIAAAVNACIPAGDCVVEGHGSGQGSASSVCYENGVRLFSSIGINGNTATARQGASLNGRTCYSVDMTYEIEGMGTVTFKDGDGAQLAQGDLDASGTMTVECSGTSYVVGAACGGEAFSVTCAQGSCP